jgi:hypothetical protein
MQYVYMYDVFLCPVSRFFTMRIGRGRGQSKAKDRAKVEARVISRAEARGQGRQSQGLGQSQGQGQGQGQSQGQGQGQAEQGQGQGHINLHDSPYLIDEGEDIGTNSPMANLDHSITRSDSHGSIPSTAACKCT